MLYRGGMRTPNSVQIERITEELGKYGRIEGKNVFYWFQNHKARERQKQKRAALLTLSTLDPSLLPATANETKVINQQINRILIIHESVDISARLIDIFCVYIGGTGEEGEGRGRWIGELQAAVQGVG
jgi:hypothetical protein